MVNKFTRPKTIAELVDIAKSVKCTGVEYSHKIEVYPHRVQYWYHMTLSSEFGEITLDVYDYGGSGDEFDFVLGLQIALDGSDIKTVDRNKASIYSPLFGGYIFFDDILDILDYIDND